MGIANELITRGWVQGLLQDSHGRVCLVGAIDAAYKDAHEFGRACETVEALIRPTETVSIWNDDPKRTFDEVLRIAKEADEILGAS